MNRKEREKKPRRTGWHSPRLWKTVTAIVTAAAALVGKFFLLPADREPDGRAPTGWESENCADLPLNGGGKVCLAADPAGYRAAYVAGAGARGHEMDFNLVCGGQRYGDGGAFAAKAKRAPYTYVFAVGSHGLCHVTVYDRSRGGEADSPGVDG
jgi:hypothetical protein